jgi:uncharacterized protein YegP (UPF0339 family)
MKVHVFQGEDGFWYWHLKAENGEIISDSAQAAGTRAMRFPWLRS